MEIFIGNCKRHQSSQMNILTTMKKGYYYSHTTLKKLRYVIPVITTKNS